MLFRFLYEGPSQITGATAIATLKLLALLGFAASLAGSVLLTALVRKLSICVGFVAQPAADRYHKTPVPLGGGIAIFTTVSAFLLSTIFVIKFLVAPGRLAWLADSVTIHAPGFLTKVSGLLIVLACMFALFLLGLVDDIRRLGPYSKLAVQFAVAIAAAGFADIRVEFFIQSRLITSILSAFWIVLIINAFNFLDNMDGLSAGIAAIAVGILLVAAVLSGQVFVSALAIILIGTLLGFLVFNFPPARIFMGDAGSLVVGFLVALLTIRTTYYHQAGAGPWYPVFIPVIVMAVPLYDFISVTFLRLSQGKSPFVGDTQHFSHRLKRHGLTDTQTVLTLYLATLCTGLGACFLYQVNLAGAILIFVQTALILAVIAIFESTVKNDRKAD